jgi:hypothetical protein
MKTNKTLIAIWVCLITLGSCTNDLNVQPKATFVLDLNNLSYQLLDSVLRTNTSVILKDGDSQIPISSFVPTQDCFMSNSEQAVIAYEVPGNDSITISRCNDFISFRIGESGDQLAYVCYSSPIDQQAAMASYAKLKSKLKPSYSAVKSSANAQSLKINITDIQRNMLDTSVTSEVSSANDRELITPRETVGMRDTSAVSKSPIYKVGLYPFPRTEVTIHLLQNPHSVYLKSIPHELVWQQEDVKKSIKNVFKNDKENAPTLRFITSECSFKSSSKSIADLNDFVTYVADHATQFPNGGRDIYFFVRNIEWRDAAGVSPENSYNINSINNVYAYGLAATSCIYHTVLAHELGHIFGAQHTSTPKSKVNCDVMNPYAWAWTKPYHLTNVVHGTTNRNNIYTNLKKL